MRCTLKFAVVVVLGFLAGVAPVLAQERIDETRPLEPDARVYVQNVSGSVMVKAWDRKEIHITGYLGEGTKRLDIEGDRERLEVEVIIPKFARHVEGSELEIRLPATCRIDVATVSADIDVDGLEGRINLESVSGDIRAIGKPDETQVESVSGDIDLDIESRDVRVQVVSGDITLEGTCEEVAAQTVSGDIDIRAKGIVRLDANGVSGDLVFEGSLAEDGYYGFECHSGTVVLALTGSIDADFEIESFNGRIDSDFGPEQRRRHKHAPGVELRFTEGSGGAEVRIETFSGDVELRQQ